MNVFVVAPVFSTSTKQEDLLVDDSAHVVISINEMFIAQLHEKKRLENGVRGSLGGAWNRDYNPKPESG